MKGTRYFWGTMTVGVSILLLGTWCSASTLIVGKPNTACPNAQYTTITAAVNAAAPGDEIKICPALYPEQLIITKALTLRGVLTPVNISSFLPCCNEVKRVSLQPSLQDLQGLPFEAVITVMNTARTSLSITSPSTPARIRWRVAILLYPRFTSITPLVDSRIAPFLAQNYRTRKAARRSLEMASGW